MTETVQLRKRLITVEEIFHEGGPPEAVPLRRGAVLAVIANAVDLPGHPAVQRCPATDLQPDSDLGERPVTHAVGALAEAEIATALDAGLRRAEALVAACEIIAAALHLQGRTILTAAARDLLSAPGDAVRDCDRGNAPVAAQHGLRVATRPRVERELTRWHQRGDGA